VHLEVSIAGLSGQHCLLLASLLLLGIVENLLHNLLLLNQESADDALPNAGSAARSAICSSDMLDTLRLAMVFPRAERRDASQLGAAITALWQRSSLLHVQDREPASIASQETLVKQMRICCECNQFSSRLYLINRLRDKYDIFIAVNIASISAQ
jgi:hypothetical protein